MMAKLVFILCALTSLTCAFLLLRGYFKNGVRLLLWSGLCFIGLAFNNILLLFDLYVVPGVNLSVWRVIPALAGLMLLIYGLIWETP